MILLMLCQFLQKVNFLCKEASHWSWVKYCWRFFFFFSDFGRELDGHVLRLSSRGAGEICYTKVAGNVTLIEKQCQVVVLHICCRLHVAEGKPLIKCECIPLKECFFFSCVILSFAKIRLFCFPLPFWLGSGQPVLPKGKPPRWKDISRLFR